MITLGIGDSAMLRMSLCSWLEGNPLTFCDKSESGTRFTVHKMTGMFFDSKGILIRVENEVMYRTVVFSDIKPEIDGDYLLYTLKTKQDEIGVILYHPDDDTFKEMIKQFIVAIPTKPVIKELKLINKSVKRYKKLLFCEKIQDQSNEFRFRPTGAGYKELRVINKGKFVDL
jgi:hypothetical protein